MQANKVTQLRSRGILAYVLSVFELVQILLRSLLAFCFHRDSTSPMLNSGHPTGNWKVLTWKHKCVILDKVSRKIKESDITLRYGNVQSMLSTIITNVDKINAVPSTTMLEGRQHSNSKCVSVETVRWMPSFFVPRPQLSSLIVFSVHQLVCAVALAFYTGSCNCKKIRKAMLKMRSRADLYMLVKKGSHWVVPSSCKRPEN